MKIFRYDVVIPFYNNHDSIVQAVLSVIKQETNQPILLNKIIIVDDGSSSPLDISQFPEAARAFLKIYRKKNGGAASARNHGLGFVNNCEFVAFLDADDFWLPTKVDKSFSVFTDRGIGLIGTLSNSHDFGLSNSSLQIFDVSFAAQLKRNYFLTSSVMINLLIVPLEFLYFPEDQRHAEEGDLFLRIVKNFRAVLLPEILVNYSHGKRGHGISGLSANYLGMQIGEVRNYVRCYARRDIGIVMLSLLLAFSFTKFLRRLVINAVKGT